MIPGLTPVGTAAISELPEAYSLAEPNPLAAVLGNPSAELIYVLSANAATGEPAEWIRFTHEGGTGLASATGGAALPDERYTVSIRFRLLSLPTSPMVIGPWANAAAAEKGEAPVPLIDGTNAYFYLDEDGVLWWRCYSSLPATPVDIRCAIGRPTVGDWHHAAVVCSHPDEVLEWYGYLDGQTNNAWWVSSNTGDAAFVTSPGTMRWGDLQPLDLGAGDFRYYGDLDRIRIWDAPLSSTAVYADSQGEDVSPADLIFACDFTDGEGTTATSTEGPDLTLTATGVLWGDAVGETARLYLASRDYRTGADDAPPHTLMPARLSVPYSAEVTVLSDGTPVAGAPPAFGVVEILNTDGDLDDLTTWSWYGRDLEIKVGTRAIPFAQWATVFRGAAEGVSWDYDRIVLSLRPPAAGLAIPAQANRYAGRGACLRFDGVDDHASGTLATGFSGSRTFEGWFRVLGWPAAAGQIINNGLSTDAGAMYVWATATASKRLGARLVKDSGDAGVAVVPPDNIVTLGEWAHVAVVYDAADAELRLYLDGELVGSIAVPFTPATGPTAFSLGRSVAGAQYLNGEIDEVRLWTTARTQAEIRDNMNRRLTGVEAGLAHYWRLDEGTGTALANAVTGAAALTATGPVWVGSLEGLEDVAGRAKPLVYGRCAYVEPVLIDPAKLIFQVHDGPIESFVGVYDQGAALTFAADSTDIYATAPSAGQYRTDVSRGLLRLGSSPVGPLTATVEGDASGTGYTEEVGEIMRRIALRCGLEEDQLDSGSFAALSAARAGAVGYVVPDGATGEQALTELADGVGAYWTFDRHGLLSVGIVEGGGTAVAEITALGTIERLPAPTPIKRWRIGYGRVHRPHSANEIAGSVYTASPSTWLALQQEWRFAVAESSEVGTAHATADDVEILSHYVDEADAREEAERRLALYSVPRDVYTMALARYRHQLDVGQTVLLRLSRFGLSGGKQMVVVGWAEDASSGDMRVTLWG